MRSNIVTLPRGWTADVLARVPARARARLGIVCVTAAALLFPLVNGNDADIDSAANALAFAALALGLNIVVGFAGLLDLGYAAFFAIGAYAYGVASSWQLQPQWSNVWEPFQWLDLVSRFHTAGGDVVHFQVSFWLMLPVAAAIAAFFGVLFGAPTLRLKGDYLAIVTLGFGEIVPIVARNTPSVTNGAMGLNGVAAPRLFGYDFGVNATPYYYVGLALVAFLILTSHRLKDSRIGRAWMAIREDEIAAAAMGVDRVRFKLLAFAIGAAFAGATGTFYVAKLQTATPEMFMFPVSVMVLVMIVFGGIGSVWGVVVGALLLQILQSWFLQDLSQWLHALGRLVNIEWLQHVELASSIELIFGFILTRLRLRPTKHVAVAPIAGSSRVLVETSLTGTDQWPKRLQEAKPRDRSRGNGSTKRGRDPWQSRQVDGRGDRPNVSQPLCAGFAERVWGGELLPCASRATAGLVRADEPNEPAVCRGAG